MMNPLGTAVVLGLLVAVWGQLPVLRPACDSPEVEEAALVAQDYLNGQHSHGYKYALNRIEDVKVYVAPNGEKTYKLEVDLLETNCHVLDPTPLANCTVRPKSLTAVEGDCDIVLKTLNGALTVTAFKCKTEESTEDLCINCPKLLPLNDTVGLDFVHVTLGTLNNMTENNTFGLLEVGRMSSQVAFGGPLITAEYVVGEASCTDGACVLLGDANAARGICTAKGTNSQHSVDCKIFPVLVPVVELNGTAPVSPLPPPVVQNASISHKHGLSFHKLTTFHNPDLSGLLSAESAESAEVVPVVAAAAGPVPAAADPAPAAADPAPAAADPAPAVDSGSASDSSHSAEILLSLFKREVPAAPVPIMANATVAQAAPIQPVQMCPGRVRYF